MYIFKSKCKRGITLEDVEKEQIELRSHKAGRSKI